MIGKALGDVVLRPIIIMWMLRVRSGRVGYGRRLHWIFWDIMGYSGIHDIMFFWKDPPQTEGRRHAHLLIKKSPVSVFQYRPLFRFFRLLQP